MPDANGRPTVGDALGAVDARMRELEKRVGQKDAADEEARAREQLSRETINLVNNEFGLTGDKAITPDTEGLDYSDPIKFNHSLTKTAAARVKSMMPQQQQSDENDDSDDEEEEDDESPLTTRRLERAINRVMGGATTASPRPTTGHRTVTVDDVRSVAESAGGARGMAASVAQIKDLQKRAASDPKVQRFFQTQDQAMRR